MYINNCDQANLTSYLLLIQFYFDLLNCILTYFKIFNTANQLSGSHSKMQSKREEWK